MLGPKGPKELRAADIGPGEGIDESKVLEPKEPKELKAASTEPEAGIDEPRVLGLKEPKELKVAGIEPEAGIDDEAFDSQCPVPPTCHTCTRWTSELL